jgi:hypothetical protein
VLFNPEQFQGEGDANYSCSLLVGASPHAEVFVGEQREGGGISYTKKIKLSEAIESVGKESGKTSGRRSKRPQKPKT